jgi:hypothetical protein
VVLLSSIRGEPTSLEPAVAGTFLPVLRGRRYTTSNDVTPPEAFAIEVGDLIAAGSIRPPLELRKTYLGREVRAEVQADGRVRFESRVFNSLSLAAAAARAAVKGDPPPPRKYWQTNGWSFWNFRDVDGTWRPIGVLRQRHLQTSPSS